MSTPPVSHLKLLPVSDSLPVKLYWHQSYVCVMMVWHFCNVMLASVTCLSESGLPCQWNCVSQTSEHDQSCAVRLCVTPLHLGILSKGIKMSLLVVVSSLRTSLKWDQAIWRALGR